MVSKEKIEKCEDLTALKRLCLEQNDILFLINKTLDFESKGHINPESAITNIRNYIKTPF